MNYLQMLVARYFGNVFTSFAVAFSPNVSILKLFLALSMIATFPPAVL